MTADPNGGSPPRDSGTAADRDIADSGATIYTTPNCVQCVATKRAFQRLDGVPYTLVDVSTDNEARDMLAGMGYRSAPVVITATGEHWSGFRPDRISALSNQEILSSKAAHSRTAPTGPLLEGAALAWAQAMAERMRTGIRAATETGLSL